MIDPEKRGFKPVASRTRVSPWPKARGTGTRVCHEAQSGVAHGSQVLQQKGFHATSLDDVAAQLNVTKPTLYHYFSNKDDNREPCLP
jgi:hypothetical protein